MKFTAGKLPGLWLIDLDPRADDRGSLLKSFDGVTFAAAGLNTQWRQTLLTRTSQPGTIRGLHWQAEPHPEIKLVTCLRGRIWDCAVDIRPNSPTFGQWEAFDLDSARLQAFYIPAGYAHGLQTLEPDTEVHYHISADYHGDLQRGLHWDDPTAALPWPIRNPHVSPKDSSHSFLSRIS